MADLKKVLTEEIRRLAKKEAKIAFDQLSKKLAELKKTVSYQSKLIKSLRSSGPSPRPSVQNSDNAEEEKSVRLNAKGIKKIREKLALSQKQFAQLIDSSLLSVSHWELGKSAPRAEFKYKIAALRKLGKREILKLFAEKNISEERPKRGRKPSKNKVEVIAATAVSEKSPSKEAIPAKGNA